MCDCLEKVRGALKACSAGPVCGEGCPYEWMHNDPGGINNCIAAMCQDTLALIDAQEARKEEARAMLKALEETAEAVPGDDGEMPAHLVPRELLLKTFGHGWQETHFIGDDEDPEQVDMMECVWINGHITDEEGSHGEADSDYWREHYGKRYGIRVWTGDREPTDEERKAAKWDDC